MSLLKRDRLQYEFLPAAEEIVETPAAPLGHIVIWLITALLIIAGCWSYFGRLDVVAVANGKISSEGRRHQGFRPGAALCLSYNFRQKTSFAS